MATAEKETDQLKKDIHQLQEDIKALTRDFQKVGEAQGREAMARTRKAGESIVNEAKDLHGRADEQIRKDPLTSVLVAFGVGLVVGKLLDRR